MASDAAPGPSVPQDAATTGAEVPVECPALDRDAFKRTLHLHALRVPNKKLGGLQKRLKGYVLNQPRLKNIIPDGDKATKLLLLSEETCPADSDLPEVVATAVEEEGDVKREPYKVELGYKYFHADDVLKALMPIEPPASFETIGHIAHLNLRPEHLPYKNLIGQVLLDKNPALRTIVNKVGNIDNEYRVFEMEVLAGEPDFVATVKQHTARFQLDFSKVYWNSRLEVEHKRLVDTFKETDTVADLMAGIGPFAVPAAQRGCTVLANDLNPDSVTWLARNIELNKMRSKILPFRMCAREFVRLLAATPGGPADNVDGLREKRSTESSCTAGPKPVPAIPECWSLPAGGVKFQHAIMNLPASAELFLDAFRGAFDPQTWAPEELPTAHVYMFAYPADGTADCVARCEEVIGAKLPHADARYVRKVSPSKDMFLVSFRVPPEAAFEGREGAVKVGEPEEKRQRV